MIRTVSISGEEGGLHPLVTALEEEGFEDASSERLVEGFARHLMVAMDRWQEEGFASIAHEYAARLKGVGDHPVIEENGDLSMVGGDKRQTRRAFLPALRKPAWRDPASGGPRA
jgi:biotin-(acetyl-CoA carboxylase) ligase